MELRQKIEPYLSEADLNIDRLIEEPGQIT